jgi:hypothetical protein
MIANQIAGLLTGGVAASLTDYESIATVTVGAGGTSSIDFTSITSSYSHLQIRFIARTNRATNPDYFNLRFNSDSGANYSAHLLSGNGSAASASAYTTQNQIYLDGGATGAGQLSNNFAVGVLDILDYSNTNKNKTSRHLLGYDNNGSGVVYLSSGRWGSNSAISTITLTSGSGSTIQQYSSFALYGIK